MTRIPAVEQTWRVIPDGREATERESSVTATGGGGSGFPVKPPVRRE